MSRTLAFRDISQSVRPLPACLLACCSFSARFVSTSCLKLLFLFSSRPELVLARCCWCKWPSDKTRPTEVPGRSRVNFARSASDKSKDVVKIPSLRGDTNALPLPLCFTFSLINCLLIRVNFQRDPLRPPCPLAIS